MWASHVLPGGNEVVLMYMLVQLLFQRVLTPLHVFHDAAWAIDVPKADRARTAAAFVPREARSFEREVMTIFPERLRCRAERRACVALTCPGPAAAPCAAAAAAGRCPAPRS